MDHASCNENKRLAQVRGAVENPSAGARSDAEAKVEAKVEMHEKNSHDGSAKHRVRCSLALRVSHGKTKDSLMQRSFGTLIDGSAQ